MVDDGEGVVAGDILPGQGRVRDVQAGCEQPGPPGPVQARQVGSGRGSRDAQHTVGRQLTRWDPRG